jgi:PAS domain S-box-containing protein
MSAATKPTLDDLRHVPEPVWLWDAERRRIVWANDPGLKAFGCTSLYEIVDRPFDHRDPGIERLAGLVTDLSWGQHRKVLLHLPSTGRQAPYSCDVFVHALADGRPGLLTVARAGSLEPRLQQTPPPQQPHLGDAMLASKADAFAALKRSLSDNLRNEPSAKAATLSAQAPVEAPVEIRAKTNAAPPWPVQHMLEQAPFGIVVCRGGRALFATPRAAELVGHSGAAAVAGDANLLAELHSVPAGTSLLVELQRPGLSPVLVSRHPLPWHNGPAEQFSLRALALSSPKGASTAVQATPPPAAKEQLHIAESAEGRRSHKAARQKKNGAAAEAMPTAVPADVIALDELKAILDVASDGIITLGKDGEILSLSAAAEAIFGMATPAAAGKPLSHLLHPESRRPFQDYLKGLKDADLATVFNDGREMLAINAQGGEVPLFMTIGKLQSLNSKARFCAVVRDLASWKRTENELVEARDRAVESNRQKSDFLAHISHELRTPLNAILGFSDVMRTQRFGTIGNEKYLAYANDIHASGSHLLSIVSDLLDLSKVEAGKLELDFMAVSLEEVADYALNLLKDEAGAAGVILRKSFPAKLPRVVGDQKTLRQIIINLLSNGIKYSNAGGEVLISAAIAGKGALTLRVKDTGIGMSEAEVQEVLKPYGRVENASRQRQGTGLGLPLTRSLVEANRAKFSISSKTGEGTLVEILFPGPRVLAE